MSEEDDLAERVETAEASWQEVSNGPPADDCKWGFFSYGDAPPAIGGGIGMFTWFPDRKSMLDFIANTLPYFPPGQSDLNPDEIAGNTATVVEKLRLGTISDLDGIKELNGVLVTCSQLEWIGTVNDLLTGNHPYAVHVREAFREDDEEEAEEAPIGKDEKEDFFEFLESWGI
jgi:hypothetical protein